LLAAATHNQIGSALVFTSLVTFGRHTPGSNRVTTTGGTTLTTTMRVIHGVHGHTAYGRANAAPATGAGLTQRAQAVLGVGYLTQRGAALNLHLAHLTAAQSQRRVARIASDQLHRCAGTACQLRTLAGLEL